MSKKHIVKRIQDMIISYWERTGRDPIEIQLTSADYQELREHVNKSLPVERHYNPTRLEGVRISEAPLTQREFFARDRNKAGSGWAEAR